VGFRIGTNPVSALAGCLLAIAFALCMSWVAVFLGTWLRESGAVQGIGFLVMFPLTFGSNVFVQTDTLPGFLQAFVKVNPVKYLVDTMRGLMLGGPVQKPLLITLAWMVGLIAVFAPLAIRAYRRRT
jgi:oleandomycin transport system permease protein